MVGSRTDQRSCWCSFADYRQEEEVQRVGLGNSQGSSLGGVVLARHRPSLSAMARVHPHNTEDVSKSPFFKDTAVSKEVSPCPFFFGYVKMLQEMRAVAIGR